MTEVGIWDVTGGKPNRLKRGAVDLENQLETWIEIDPALIQQGLSIVGRQVPLDAGRLDLLGLDLLGNWVIIEIKRGNVRRETVLQALDYAACIRDLPACDLSNLVNLYLSGKGIQTDEWLARLGFGKSVFDQRRLSIVVVGTGRDTNLERLTRFLADTGIPINVINIDVFENGDQRFLLRRLTELDLADPNQKSSSTQSGAQLDPGNPLEIARLLAEAEARGIGPSFRKVHDAAARHGLLPRAYKNSIMYAPPQHKGRMLVYTSAYPRQGKMNISWSPSAFAEFYPISEREAVDMLGEQPRNLYCSEQEIEHFTTRLDALFAQIARNS